MRQDRAEDVERVAAFVRVGAMPAVAAHPRLEAVDRGQAGAVVEVELAGFAGRDHVQGDHLVYASQAPS